MIFNLTGKRPIIHIIQLALFPKEQLLEHFPQISIIWLIFEPQRPTIVQISAKFN